MDPFRVDPPRLYDVRPDGSVETDVPVPAGAIARHHVRLRRWWVAAVLLNAVTMAGTAVAAALFGWGLAARVAVVAMLALPLLAVAPVLARVAAPGGRRRHRRRPRDFPDP